MMHGFMDVKTELSISGTQTRSVISWYNILGFTQSTMLASKHTHLFHSVL